MTFEKKIASYNLDENDFKLPEELTVTITLNEYRSLIQRCTMHYEETRNRNEVNALKEKIAKLETQIERMEREIEVIS